MPDGRWRMADGGWEVRSGEGGDGQSGERTPQAPSEEMLQEQWDYAYGPTRPRSRATMIAGMSGGCEGGESERGEPTQEECLTPENAQNEANPESTQSSLPLKFESSEAEPADRKRSQSAASGAAPDEEERVASSGDKGGHREL
jgi:hypothetical protein